MPSFVLPYSRSIRGKVRADVEKVIGDTLYLNKQFVRIKLVDSLKDIPLEDIPPTTNPTFLVPRDYKDLLLHNRIDAILKTHLKEETSRILLIGEREAEHVMGIPADTLQDNRGIEEEYVKEFIKVNEEKLSQGKLALVLLGAHSVGRLGQKFFEEVFCRKVDSIMGYDLQPTV